MPARYRTGYSILGKAPLGSVTDSENRLGPGSDYAPTRVSVQLLLDQMGYSEVPIEETTCSLRRP